MFGLARELAKLPGVRMVKLHNCMFFGGRKRKESCFCTNVEEIAGLIARLCSNRNGICDRTGASHDSWKPKVVEGKVLEFKSEIEAEFQPELCKCYAQGAAAFLAKLGKDLEWDFVEFLAGPRSPLTCAMKEAVVPCGAAVANAGQQVGLLRVQRSEGSSRCEAGGSRGAEPSVVEGPGIPSSGMEVEVEVLFGKCMEVLFGKSGAFESGSAAGCGSLLEFEAKADVWEAAEGCRELGVQWRFAIPLEASPGGWEQADGREFAEETHRELCGGGAVDCERPADRQGCVVF